ncbi:hypothetical protein CF68_07155 [Cupriavidus sp. SK-4]|nr:hypothetical protein CF68_07155 [Cupriavidus sp. SK-4]
MLSGGDHGIAGDHQVGHGHVDAARMQGVRAGGDLDVAPGGPAHLRHAGRVLGDHALAFEVGGHAQHAADGDDAGAADPRHHDALRLAGVRQRGHRDGRRRGAAARGGGGLLQLAAFDRDR